jgi:chromosome segregation ATPase
MAKDTDQRIEHIHDKLDEVASCVHKIDRDLAVHKSTFDDHLKQDERMYEEFKRMNDILQQNTESLKEHMHRTALLEELVQKMDIRISPLEKQQIEEIAVKQYRNDQMIKVAKIVGALTGAMALLGAIKEFILK